jgi:hypothetical protein
LLLFRTLFLVACAGVAQAQHEGHDDPGAPASPARFAFQATVLYAQYNSNHGDSRFGLRDWEHFRSRRVLRNTLSFRGMTSLASLIPDSAGMPLLLQTGGTYKLAYIHDRQHRHDLIMEAAAELRAGAVFVYLAPVGAPALGPDSYMHRPSAASDPVAPLGHHWQDAMHGSYGVVTAGASAAGMKLEASAFNARESDVEQPWPDFSRARLDSYSARLSGSRARVGLSSWYACIAAHDPVYPAMQMHRYGASASHASARASTLAVWAMNVHHHDASSHALMHGDAGASPHARSSSLLLETDVMAGPGRTVFARAERVMKSAEELGFQGGNLMELFDIRSVSAGVRHDVRRTRYAVLGAGARAAFTFLPRSLELAYGTRRPTGFELFLQARALP